eukprot:gnl/TRDRNA2_/TRDRNA2_154371_c0_seq2.p1 gnl/TRDRNA2_/TRDRNA2_154371_c0~~gnl/TRDRNA2_/TRDRNA2_154371_c0_seq2.p1  ORF type:complete len:423 (-),score=103.47 gnl/TRDRNA2_/TRDRNA2_154371_c0_seq2:224-1456(-)
MPCAAGGADALLAHRGVYSSWLFKEKSDESKTKWFASSVRRYFTIDFDSKIIFYSNSEGNKKVSMPVSFKEICHAWEADRSEALFPAAGARRMSMSSLLGRTTAAPAGPCCFVVETLPGKRIRLAADDAIEARRWVDALNVASALGRGDSMSLADDTSTAATVTPACSSTAGGMHSSVSQPSTAEGSESGCSRATSAADASAVEAFVEVEEPAMCTEEEFELCDDDDDEQAPAEAGVPYEAEATPATFEVIASRKACGELPHLNDDQPGADDDVLEVLLQSLQQSHPEQADEPESQGSPGDSAGLADILFSPVPSPKACPRATDGNMVGRRRPPALGCAAGVGDCPPCEPLRPSPVPAQNEGFSPDSWGELVEEEDDAEGSQMSRSGAARFAADLLLGMHAQERSSLQCW